MSGRGPGFPLPPTLPSTFTHDHLTGLRHVTYDPKIATLVSNPVAELVQLRNGTLASEHALVLGQSSTHLVPGTGWPHDASTSDVVITVSVPALTAGQKSAIGVRVLANVSTDEEQAPFGGILTVVNFTAPDTNGTRHAVASIRTLDPCGVGSGSSGLSTATFPILRDELTLDIRLLIDRSTVEAFLMGGRVVFRHVQAVRLVRARYTCCPAHLGRRGVIQCHRRRVLHGLRLVGPAIPTTSDSCTIAPRRVARASYRLSPS